jgi:hypothetical protein
MFAINLPQRAQAPMTNRAFYALDPNRMGLAIGPEDNFTKFGVFAISLVAITRNLMKFNIQH